MVSCALAPGTFYLDLNSVSPRTKTEAARAIEGAGGRNEALASKLGSRKWKMPVHVVGFTKEVHRLMRAADFLIGKPGPGSIAEAMIRKLPVLIECNAWTLPQRLRGKRTALSPAPSDSGLFWSPPKTAIA